MFAQLRPALVATVLFTGLLGVGYPLAVTGVGQLAFPAQADGGLVRDAGGAVVGSRLLAQGFSAPGHLHPRPSAAGADGYDASATSGSNLGPLNPALAERITGAASELGGGRGLPADALTTSGSGLDPDISPANARFQAARIAQARGVPQAAVQAIIDRHTTPSALGFIGQPAVNVLETNLALDKAWPAPQPPAR